MAISNYNKIGGGNILKKKIETAEIAMSNLFSISIDHVEGSIDSYADNFNDEAREITILIQPTWDLIVDISYFVNHNKQNWTQLSNSTFNEELLDVVVLAKFWIEAITTKINNLQLNLERARVSDIVLNDVKNMETYANNAKHAIMELDISIKKLNNNRIINNASGIKSRKRKSRDRKSRDRKSRDRKSRNRKSRVRK